MISVDAVLALVIDAPGKPDPEVRKVIQYADRGMCLVFFCGFLRNFTAAENKWRYMATWGWLDWLSSIAMVDALRGARLFHVIRLLRGMRALRVVTGFVAKNRTHNTILATALVCFLLVVLGSIAAIIFARPAGGTIVEADQALWWAIVTMTIVGYGDIYPVSSGGRIIAVVLMVGGAGQSLKETK